MNQNLFKYPFIKYIWIVIFILFLSRSISIYGTEGNPIFEEFENYIKKRMESTRTPSMVIAVSQKDRIIWERSFGWADRENRIKAMPITIYSVASVSKPMTATAMMILRERGLLDLDKPVDSYLGETHLTIYKGETEDVTVNRLLHHTAGLPTIWNFYFEDSQVSRPDISKSISKFGIITNTPGTDYEYSNLGYGIAEFIIEQISGNSFDQFMNSEVFEPLGMDNTFVITNKTQYETIAPRYLENRNKSPFYEVMSHGGGGICSSVKDLLRFGRFHIKNRLDDQIQVLSDHSIDFMQTAVDPSVPDSPYKIGWNIKNYKGYNVASHGGGMPGVSSALLLVPKQELVVAILSNGTYIDLMEIGYYLISMLIPEKEKPEVNSSEKKIELNEKIEFPSENFTGIWKGKIYTEDKKIPVTLNINESGIVKLKLKEKEIEPISEFTYRYATLSGTFDFNIGTKETSNCRNKVHFKLRLINNQLLGYAAAESHRVEVFYLPYFISLIKQ